MSPQSARSAAEFMQCSYKAPEGVDLSKDSLDAFIIA
jgi:hypothetical protein